MKHASTKQTVSAPIRGLFNLTGEAEDAIGLAKYFSFRPHQGSI